MTMHFTLVELDKTYKASALILLACTIPCAFLVSQSTSLDPNMVLAAAPFCLALVASIFLLHPPTGTSHLVCDIDRIGHSQRSFVGHQLSRLP